MKSSQFPDPGMSWDNRNCLSRRTGIEESQIDFAARPKKAAAASLPAWNPKLLGGDTQGPLHFPDLDHAIWIKGAGRGRWRVGTGMKGPSAVCSRDPARGSEKNQ